MDRERKGAGPVTWALRVVFALAALAAPIITFKAFTDKSAPDPERQQRLREVRQASEGAPDRSHPAPAEADSEPRP